MLCIAPDLQEALGNLAFLPADLLDQSYYHLPQIMQLGRAIVVVHVSDTNNLASSILILDVMDDVRPALSVCLGCELHNNTDIHQH